MKMFQPLWVSYGHTESGDDISPLIWGHFPTELEINAKYKILYPEEYEVNGFVNWTLIESEYIE